MDPTEIAADVLGIERASLTPARRIKEGLTNESWWVGAVDSDRAWIVRFSNTREGELQIDRRSEAAILAAVSKAKIGPTVVVCAPERHLLITECLSGAAWTSRAARQTDNLHRIAELLRVLHALQPPSDAARTDLRAVVTGYWNTLMASGLGARAGTLEQRDRARLLIAEFEADGKAVLCHNDIHHLNVIDGGQLRLVDWEYAGVGDPYFDLASICCYHAFNDRLRAHLLRSYLGFDRPAALERLHRMCWLFDYIRDLWFAVREMK